MAHILGVCSPHSQRALLERCLMVFALPELCEFISRELLLLDRTSAPGRRPILYA